jgi:DegV family protein with EDD domain
MQKIIVSADSTCDLGPELKERYHIHYFPFHIALGEEEFVDSVDIFPEDIYAAYEQRGILPKTSAINVKEYYEYFKPWVDDGYEVVHINLGSAISSTHQNCCLAAEALRGVYVVDSQNLSTGMGLLVLEAAKRAEQGMPARQIAQEVQELVPKSHASFILNTLEFLKAGGRCSALVALGANMLNLKPCIEVDNRHGGEMKVGKKYKGKLDRVLKKYVQEQLSRYSSYRRERVFITHSGISPERIALVERIVREQNLFDEVHVTQASCTISSHCGPNTLGVLFLTE